MGKPPKVYPESVAEQLDVRLDSLAENPKGLQVKELVFRARSKIEAAQAAGYSLEDILKEFEAVGVSLTLNTLKQYLREARSNPDSASESLSSNLEPSGKAVANRKKAKTQGKSKSSSEQPLVEEEQSHDDHESKQRLTNTNEEGFQEMLNDDEL